MDFNLVTNLESCHLAIKSFFENNYLLYYSHIPTAAASLLLGLFVFFKNRKDISAKLFLIISALFSLWSYFDIILWTSDDSRKTMFFWSIINLVENLVTGLTLYFAYVFLEKKDIALKFKLFFAVLFLPYVFLTPTIYNMAGFNVAMCEAEQGSLVNYFYFLEFLFFLIFLIYAIKKIIEAKGEEKKRVFYFLAGVFLFLASFSGANIAGSLAAVLNPNNPDNWKILQYGLFGMPVFTGLLAYLITKYKAFDIKLLGSQALVIALVALVGSEFFFISLENTTAIILISVTVLFSTIFGIVLINSVKNEVRRKEELQVMSDKLAQANDQLRKLDNSKSEFISIASHQLRTPITAIKGFMSLLLEGSYGKINPKQEDALNKAYTSNERLLHLVEDLLNVSRIESGRMEFKFAPTKVEDICQEVVDTLMMKAKVQKLYLDYQIPKNLLPELMIDGTKVREVISNMVDNAIKYTEKGGITVRIEQGLFPKVQPSKKVEPSVRVIVSDTGIGIPQPELPYLFSKFSRGKDVARLNTGGTGLGLYVGKAMIEENGGKIWAESDGEGKGSRFIIELPVKQDEELIKRWGH